MIRNINCIICGKKKRIIESKNRSGRTICCSRKCANKYHSIMMKGRTDIIKHILKETLKIPREKTKLAYMAGLVDGEGCLRINKEDRCSVIITNTDIKMIEWVKFNFGGIIYLEEREKNNWKSCYTINIRKTKDILKLLIAIKPYLTIKIEQADKLILRCNEIIKRYDRLSKEEDLK